MIALRNITKLYRDAAKELRVIENLSLELPERGSVAIVGTSGVGKSTLLHLLGGLDRPNAGSVCFDDVDIAALGADALAAYRGKNIGFVFQSHHLLPEFSALENVALPLIIAGVSDVEAEDRARAVLNAVGLQERVEHRPSELSGGEQQRVAIARAVVTEPRVIFADEPTGNLDPATGAQIQQLLFAINQRLQNLLVVVTHNMELARSMDVTLEMRPGGLLARV